MGNVRRIGLFGGSFDPIHNTHCSVARAALCQAQLDHVLFIIAPRPPHKQTEAPDASADERYAMVCAAVAGEPAMDASRVELDRAGVSYTVDTVKAVEQAYPGASLFLILGMDSLIDLPRWRDPDGILSRVHILAVPRPNLVDVPAPVLHGKYTLLDFTLSPTSSTEIRERIAAGEPWRELVPPGVYDYIVEKGLYGAHR